MQWKIYFTEISDAAISGVVQTSFSKETLNFPKEI